jgi:biotin synthase-like enzyme
VGRKDVKNYEAHTEVTEHYFYETVSTFNWDVKIITLGEVGSQGFKRRGL